MLGRATHRWLGMALLTAAAGIAPALLWAQPALNPDQLSMQAAVGYALEHNPELLAFVQEAALAAARERLAVADNRLQASVHGYASAVTRPHMITGEPQVSPGDMQLQGAGDVLYGNLTFYQPLYTGGRLESHIQQRRHLATATDADIQALRLRVAYLTRRAYRHVLLQEKFVAVYEQEQTARQEMLREDQVRERAGKIPKYYVLRDKSALAQAQQNLARAHRDLEIAMYDLTVRLGLAQPREVTLTDALGYTPLQADREKSLQRAAANRPELAAARARIAAAVAGTRMAASAYRPQLGARVLLESASNTATGPRGGYTAALVVSLPLVDAGSRAAAVAAAEATRQQATERDRLVGLQVSREVLDALAALKAADISVRSAMEVTASAEEDYRVATLRYAAGKAINLEPLDALAALVKARLNLAQALYDYGNAGDQLAWARGEMPK